MLGIGERTLYRNIQEWKLQDKIRQALDEAHGDAETAAQSWAWTRKSYSGRRRSWGWRRGRTK